jgi:hypothetical protein
MRLARVGMICMALLFGSCSLLPISVHFFYLPGQRQERAQSDVQSEFWGLWMKDYAWSASCDAQEPSLVFDAVVLSSAFAPLTIIHAAPSDIWNPSLAERELLPDEDYSAVLVSPLQIELVEALGNGMFHTYFHQHANYLP